MKAITLLLALSICAHAAPLQKQWQIADTALMDQFRHETRIISERCLSDITTAQQWREKAPEYRQQLAEMLSLSPLPERTPLNAKVTGRFEHDTFTVENLHFQSRPGLYVTANLYVPKNLTKPAPTILYVCGHGPVITNGVSYGNKVTYQHHGAWFARNGYVCLLIDTLQLGEIQGLHHGTHRENLWWWNSRGYTPAGVECWNSMRALDYLSTRPEVDTNRFGITGRSGGGAYSWFAAAMDDRIKAAAPVAGITDLENHVVDGVVEGHCDCMFFVNTHGWDYPHLAAMVAPRPLLLCNTDSDYIFPLDGVTRTFSKARRIYELLGASTNCGLVITPGPHKDTQELQVPVMRWFNRYLKGEEPLIETAATKLFAAQQLRVFQTLPADAVNTNVHFTFVEVARADVPKSKEAWTQQRDQWLKTLRAKSFAAWPDDSKFTDRIQGRPETTYGLVLRENVCVLSMPVRPGQQPDTILLEPRVAAPGHRSLSNAPTVALAQLLFNDLGTNGATAPARKEVQVRRRHMLLGQTLDSVRVHDIVRAIRALRASPQFGKLRLRIEAEGDMAVNALYASLFAPVDELVLSNLPASHMNGPDYLNVLRVLDIPQAVAMASERCRVELRGARAADWQFASDTARTVGFDKNLAITK